MKTNSRKTALLFATAFSVMSAAPLAAAFADTMPAAPVAQSTGIYDLADHFKTAAGFPQQGWSSLLFTATGN